MIDLKAQKPAKRYARALFEAVKDKNYDKVLNEISEFLNEMSKNPELKDFLTHPALSINDKKEAMREICKHFEHETVDFLLVLLEEGRIGCLYEIEKFLKKEINASEKKLELTVTLAIEPSENLKKTIQKELEEIFSSAVILDFMKDESIIGGMLIKKGDTLLDLSIGTKIKNFKRI